MAFFVLCVSLCLVPGCQLSRPTGALSSVPNHWSVYFSPEGGATRAVVNEIDKARGSILVQAYSFTSAPIAKALVDAHRREVDVQVILDKSQESKRYNEMSEPNRPLASGLRANELQAFSKKTRYSSADFLLHSGIPTRIDDAHAIAHNKVMVIDHRTVITGSFNFTRAAEAHNAENLLVIEDPALASRYEENWKRHAAHSRLIERTSLR